MLRMGRGFKTESPDKDKQTEAAHQPAYEQPPQHFPAPATTTTNRVEAPAYEAATPSAAPVAAATNTSRAVTESEALARDIKDGVMNGFVGATTVLSGDAEFKGMLRIDGRFTGRISSEKGTLIVSAGGVVEANVAVAVARINGTVNGDIVATDRIEFGRTAQVRGNIHTPSLIIEHGAIFEGSCRMRQDKPAAAAERPRQTETQPLQPRPQQPQPQQTQPQPQPQQPQPPRVKAPDRPERVPLAEKTRPAAAVNTAEVAK